jgi:hypothetical protein
MFDATGAVTRVISFSPFVSRISLLPSTSERVAVQGNIGRSALRLSNFRSNVAEVWAELPLTQQVAAISKQIQWSSTATPSASLPAGRSRFAKGAFKQQVLG